MKRKEEEKEEEEREVENESLQLPYTRPIDVLKEPNNTNVYQWPLEILQQKTLLARKGFSPEEHDTEKSISSS